jgi:aminopeptidase-like protein
MLLSIKKCKKNVFDFCQLTLFILTLFIQIAIEMKFQELQNIGHVINEQKTQSGEIGEP